MVTKSTNNNRVNKAEIFTWNCEEALVDITQIANAKAGDIIINTRPKDATIFEVNTEVGGIVVVTLTSTGQYVGNISNQQVVEIVIDYLSSHNSIASLNEIKKCVEQTQKMSTTHSRPLT